MSLKPEKRPLVAGIGLACLLGAVVIVWLSSPATLRLSRGDEDLVIAALESRLFGRFTNNAERIDGIRAVSLLRSRAEGSTSQTPDRLTFETTSGQVDLGRNQQLFAVDYADIATFIKNDGPESLALSSITRRRELMRFVFAQVIALVAALGGLGLVWSVMRSLMT